MNAIKNLGSVGLSGTAVVSDPCYDRDVWCMQTGLPVKPGRYKAMAIYSDEKEWGVRVANLVLVHEDYLKDTKNDWSPVCASIGVDSGQCGIFDDAVYPESKGHPDREPFYDECCGITLAKESAGILASGRGVVSGSGYGDGSYELFAKTEDNQYVALMLDYGLLEMRMAMQMLTDGQGEDDV